MAEADEARRLEVVLRRLASMGVEPRALPGGRGFAGTLALGPEPFETLAGAARRFASVTFVTVGADRIKCLRPAALFHLPMIRIADCVTAADLEARLRAAWKARQESLASARRWAEKLGATPRASEDGPFLELEIGVEDRGARARLVEAARLVLPSRGPLAGVRLRRAEDRIFLADRSIASASELDLAVATRLEELARLDARLAREARLAAVTRAEPAPPPLARASLHRLLLVGPRLAQDGTLHESLRLRGYRIATARSANDALRHFASASPDIVLTDADLGRFEGVELIPAVRGLAGVEEVPIVLVDDRNRPELRETARHAGAAGYLVRPFEVEKIAEGLSNLVRRPKRRRWTRYRERLAVRIGASGDEAMTGDVGRGGLFVWTERDLPLHAIERFEIALPESTTALQLDAEVVHRTTVPGTGRRGVGLRFHGFQGAGEAPWIAHLHGLEPDGADFPGDR